MIHVLSLFFAKRLGVMDDKNTSLLKEQARIRSFDIGIRLIRCLVD